MDRDVCHVADMVGSARLLQAYLEGSTREDFMRNVQLQDSVVRRLEIIGEAAGRVSATCREQYPTVPWGRMIAMRNRMIHVYDAVDLDIVWATVRERIPELLALIEPLVPTQPEESSVRPESE